MIIKEKKPLTLAEVAELSGDSEKGKKIKSFIKKFSKLKVEKSKEIGKELKKIDLIKLKEEHITKIIDFMPEDTSDLIKIIPGVSLDQEEANKILDVIKKY